MDRHNEWRCAECGKLLGVHTQGRLHIRYRGGNEYLVGFPVTGRCQACQRLNEVPAPVRQPQESRRTEDKSAR